MNEKCERCIDQGELCEVHYWKVLALKGRDIAKLAWDYHLAVVSLAKAINIDDSEETIEQLKTSLGEAFHKMDVAIYEFNSHSHTI